jgi:hypothetical protein
MPKVMLTVSLDEDASPASAAQKLHLGIDELDQDFGLVEIDPTEHVYAVLVDESRAHEAATEEGVGGPFANPPVEAFGVPRNDPQT